jgi:predicted TIM-barrel fold metal-dependent hydrolase
MRVDDLILISVDDHVVEPPDLFLGRLPKRFEDSAPRVIRNDDGTDAWLYDDKKIANLALNAVVGRPPAEYGIEPTSFDDLRPGCYDVHERVKDMSANGVLAGMNFPSFPRYCGQIFANSAATDPELALAVLQAYNDWHIEGWCGEYPDRLIPLCLPPIWDPELMAAEVRRVVRKGCHAITFSMNPYRLGLPSLHSDHWDPFWAACDESDVVVCMHIGSGSYEMVTSPDAPIDVKFACTAVSIYPTAADLVWSPIFQKFGNLKIALSEGGIGWVPYFLERIDYVHEHHGAWTGQQLRRKPSEVFLERIVTCFIDDAAGVANLASMNPEMVTWECDYPHSDSTWPTSPERLNKSLGALPDGDVKNISHLNVMRTFSFDPFATRDPDRCTVSALRSEVTGHDTSTLSRAKSKKRAERPTTVAEINEMRAAGNLL